MENTDRKRFLKEYWPLLLVGLGLALFFWITPFQTQDGPNHKKVAVILSRLAESPLESQAYQNNLSLFQTNQLFPLLYQPLAHFFSPDTYEKIFVGFFLFLLLLSYRYFLSNWFPENESLWILILPFLFHPLFVIGMYNFLASIPFTLLALSFLLRGVRSRNWFNIFWFFSCSYLAFLAHPFPFFILAIVWFWMIWMESPKNKLSFSIDGLIIFAFLSFGFILPFLQTIPKGGEVPYNFPSIPEFVGGFLSDNFVLYSFFSPIALLPFLLMLLGMMWFSFREVFWKYKIYWMTLLLACLVFPSSGSTGGYLNNRFLPYLWLFLPLGLKLPLHQVKLLKWISFITALYLAITLFVGMKKVDRIVLNAQDVLQALPSPSRLFPINFEPKGPAINYFSLMHLWANYDHGKVIFSPYLFANSDLMPLSWRLAKTSTYFPSNPENFPKDLKEPPSIGLSAQTPEVFWTREDSFTKISEKASYYDYWLIYSPPDDFLRFVQSLHGLQKIAEREAISLWRNSQARPFHPPLPGGPS